ncbi:hypothetical protein KIL84_008480 [Mauremys mutica]|uniref:Uncharacterized protein n=1 Tax=Mauremys mutica TaxID=74926 RepID=A0A9D3X2Y6_9SAUR|nr:hypothetical protein KIL84_008480 [Mauremys mutica]
MALLETGGADPGRPGECRGEGEEMGAEGRMGHPFGSRSYRGRVWEAEERKGELGWGSERVTERQERDQTLIHSVPVAPITAVSKGWSCKGTKVPKSQNQAPWGSQSHPHPWAAAKPCRCLNSLGISGSVFLPLGLCPAASPPGAQMPEPQSDAWTEGRQVSST